MRIRQRVVNRVVPQVPKAAPGVTAAVVRQVVDRALSGAGPLPGAAAAAEALLEEHAGEVDAAISEVVRRHTALAGAQGFVTNLGGVVTLAATIPLNITGLAVLQTRMIAVVAHLRGYDLDSPQVRNAVLLAVLGKDAVRGLVRDRTVPGPPMVLATAPAHDPALDAVIAGEVASALVSRVIGKRAAGVVVRRVPVAGGVWGGGADAWSTHQLGRYAAEELRQRPRPAVSG